MEKKEVIEEFCKLATQVGRHFDYQYSADCFCDLSAHTTFFRFDPKIINFIKQAVAEKMNQEVEAAKKKEKRFQVMIQCGASEIKGRIYVDERNAITAALVLSKQASDTGFKDVHYFVKEVEI